MSLHNLILIIMLRITFCNYFQELLIFLDLYWFPILQQSNVYSALKQSYDGISLIICKCPILNFLAKYNELVVALLIVPLIKEQLKSQYKFVVFCQKNYD